MSSPVTSPTTFQFNEKNIEYIRKTFLSGFKFRMMLMAKLPMGFLSGMRVREFTRETCKVSVPYKRLNKNPFRSTFWAVLGMAAEMSSGALVVMYTHKQKPSIAMLVTGTKATFHKKAVGRTTFVCNHGKQIEAAVRQAVETGEAVEVECPMTGFNKDGEVVAEFAFTWSLKVRSGREYEV